MLTQNNVDFAYREYTKEPLSASEIEDLLGKLKMEPQSILRSREAKKVGLTGAESRTQLIREMATNPKLIQRPIAVREHDACLARPAEVLLDWIQEP